MMKRRSILAMLGAAPVAAVVPSKPQSAPAIPYGMGLNADPFGHGVDYSDPYQVADLVTKAKMRRDAIRRRAELGLLNLGRIGPDTSFNIESLKATAPWRKALLQQEWYVQRRLYTADADIERSIKEAILPRWMWRFT